MPDRLECVPLASLERLAALDPKATPQRPITSPGGKNGGRAVEAYGRKALANEIAELEGARDGERNNALNKASYALGQLVGGGVLNETEVYNELESAALRIGLDPSEIKSTRESGMSAGKREPRCVPDPSYSTNGAHEYETKETRAEKPDPGVIHPGVSSGPVIVGRDNGEPTTELGNSERLIRYCRGYILYVRNVGWHTWDGMRWDRGEDASAGAVRHLAGKVARAIYEEAWTAENEDRRKELGRWAIKSESKHILDAMVSLAADNPAIGVSPADMDQDPMLFNCLNGTLDLRTGQLLPHDPRQYITRLAPVEYDPQAEALTWKQFISEVFAGDAEVIPYICKVVGYSLTALTTAQEFYVLYGGGSNGKSVFLNTLYSLMGDYAQAAPMSALMQSRGERIRSDIARLDGARFVTLVEMNDGQRLDEALVKKLTGGDVISARFLHKLDFDFKPVLKLFMAVNHKPVVRGTDDAVWRRIRLIPFTRKWYRQDESGSPKRDEKLAEKLLSELPGILTWAVRGCIEWQEGGLEAPQAVLMATRGYQAEMDTLADFLEEECECLDVSSMTPDQVVASGTYVLASDLFVRYTTWLQTQGMTKSDSLSKKGLGIKLDERGFVSRPASGNKRARWGLSLKDAGRNADDEGPS